MVKKMNNNKTSFFESRRTFLKGTAYTVAGATVVKGVFETIIDTPAIADNHQKIIAPVNLEKYPNPAKWDSHFELDGDDWKRGGIGRNGVQSKDNPNGIKLTEYMLVPTACSNCEAACGLTAWVDIGIYKETKNPKDLKVRKYMGNPLHAGSRGRNCAKGYAVQSQMYDPDRIPFPLKRAPGSKRGEGKWVRTSWDDAMKEIGQKMHDTLKTGDEMSRKLFMYHVGRPNENGFSGRVPHSMGCDGFDSHTNICSAGAREATIQWFNDDRNSPDWANSKLIFLQSSHAADAGHYFQQAAGRIADARKKGAKLIVMDPRLSNSAGMADLWVPCWPGTEAALYLYLANRILNEKDINGDDLVNHAWVKNWMNWDRLMANPKQLELMVEKGYIKSIPKDDSYKSFIAMIAEMYSKYTLDFVVKECRVEAKTIEKLYDMFIDAGDRVSTYIWRAGTIGHRGGWMNGRAGFLPLALRGAMAGDIGGVSLHHWHEISVNGKGNKATVSGEQPKKVDVWNELAWPPEYPLSTYEMSMILPHLLLDDEWRNKWKAKGLNVPEKISVYVPRMYNPVWINPDGFRWIEALKREDKIELSFNLSPTWSETNWYCDFILPVGLAGERHDQHSSPTQPSRWLSFRQPALRVALEKMGWKPKDPTRATLEAHTVSGLGEVWEEVEFWANIMTHYVDPDGSLGVRDHWASKSDPSRAITIPEWYQAAFDNLPNLRSVAKKQFPNSKYPNYELMRDMGTWLEEDNIYKPQERKLKKVGDTYHAHGHEYKESEVTKDEYGTLLVEGHHGEKHAIGVEVDGEIKQGFHTLSKKAEFFSEWLAEWKWPEYAVPIYPTTKEERKKMVHLVTQVHHDFMENENEFALNTIFRLPYNIHTRSVNSKHLMEISQNHNPVWINTDDARRMNIKQGDAIKVTITDTVSGLESGYFIAMAVPTEGTMPGVLANSHHAGRWKLKNAVDIPGFSHQLGVMGLGAPLYDMTMDGKVGTLKPKQGVDKGMQERRDTWQFKEYNKDLDNIWWDGLSGSWQNAVAPSHPDPIAGNHAWHQKVRIELASSDDQIGDIYVNYENNMKTYQAWRDKLTRPLNSSDTLRRPKHIKRPAVPLSHKAYSVKIKG
ncbi:Anaerobic dehydrogenases, typically selenocysteine-containing [hydrothermal vent metagenome]|uniref:Anaerobic dehydrogenases, typically selenocysteine-containing n=1 Tax=hydrothermal vent metagenome TaxID=652676 RepID=A0A1W1C7L6_9ZZZZ